MELCRLFSLMTQIKLINHRTEPVWPAGRQPGVCQDHPIRDQILRSYTGKGGGGTMCPERESIDLFFEANFVPLFWPRIENF